MRTSGGEGDLTTPLVSVVTPVYNGARYIEGAIQSVLAQNYPHVEHMLMDGGSRDGTLGILTRYSSDHPGRIRFVSEPDRGPGDAWNKGLKMSRGDVLTCIGADDICEAGAIQAVVDFFNSHPGAFFVHGECDLINSRGEIIGRHKVEDFNLNTFVNTAKYIATPSAYYKRCVLERVGWLDSSGDDFDLMIRIAREFRIHKLDRVLSKLRLHADSAFNPTDLQQRINLYRQTYRVSRRYGGHILSPIALRYYCGLVFGWLGLGAPFSAMRRLFRILRGLPGRI